MQCCLHVFRSQSRLMIRLKRYFYCFLVLKYGELITVVRECFCLGIRVSPTSYKLLSGQEGIKPSRRSILTSGTLDDCTLSRTIFISVSVFEKLLVYFRIKMFDPITHVFLISSNTPQRELPLPLSHNN